MSRMADEDSLEAAGSARQLDGAAVRARARCIAERGQRFAMERAQLFAAESAERAVPCALLGSHPSAGQIPACHGWSGA